MPPMPTGPPPPQTDLVVVCQLLSGPHLLHHEVPKVTLRLEVGLEDVLLGHRLDL